MKFKVYFDVYGRKMMTTVEADTAAQAAQKVRDKLKIDKVDPIGEPDLPDVFKQIFWK